MERSYEYAVGSVRVRELKLLRRADLETLLAAGSADELLTLLRDKGHGDGATVDELLAMRTRALWEYVASVAPDMAAFDCLLCQNDAHNVKLIIKSILHHAAYERLVLTPVTVPVEDIAGAVKERRFDRLPPWIAAAAETAFETVAGAEDAQLADAVIDRAAMVHMLETAKAVKSPFLTRYMTMTVAYMQVKLALRAARIGKSAAFLEQALCPVEGLELAALMQMTLKSEAALTEWLAKQPAYDLPAAMEAYGQSPSAFEKWVDDRLMAEALTCKRVTLGPEPLIGYVLAVEAENKVIHILASGLKTGQPETAIRERVRELYG